MFPELDEIRLIRKRLDLTQHQLAKKAGISQSLIAKVEAGKLDPAYSKAKKLFNTLRLLSDTKKVKASEVMKKKIIAAKPEENIADVIKDMRKHGISQLPVIQNKELIGLVSETSILNALIEGKKNKIEDIMEERPPSVAKDTSIDIVSNLLKYFSLVAVFEKDKLLGVITKSDVLKKL